MQVESTWKRKRSLVLGCRNFSISCVIESALWKCETGFMSVGQPGPFLEEYASAGGRVGYCFLLARRVRQCSLAAGVGYLSGLLP